MNKVLGIGGVFFEARDALALVKWYEKQFGLAFEHYEEAGNWFTVFTFSREPDDGRQAATIFAIEQAKGDLAENGRGFTINLAVDNLEETITTLTANGVPVKGPEKCEYGSFAWVTDPEGNRIELWEPPLRSELSGAE